MSAPGLRLTIQRNGQQSAFAIPAGQEVIIGSAPECTLTLADDSYVSRRHLRLSAVDGQIWADDLASSNGTYLRIRRSILLEVGDELMIGTALLRVEEIPPKST